MSFRCPRLTCVRRASLTVALRFPLRFVFSLSLSLLLTLRRDCREPFRKPLSTSAARRQAGQVRFHARWPVNKRRDGVSVAAAVDADDRRRFETKMGGVPGHGNACES